MGREIATQAIQVNAPYPVKKAHRPFREKSCTIIILKLAGNSIFDLDCPDKKDYTAFDCGTNFIFFSYE
jgi:hypothetical protein